MRELTRMSKPNIARALTCRDCTVSIAASSNVFTRNSATNGNIAHRETSESAKQATSANARRRSCRSEVVSPGMVRHNNSGMYATSGSASLANSRRNGSRLLGSSAANACSRSSRTATRFAGAANHRQKCCAPTALAVRSRCFAMSASSRSAMVVSSSHSQPSGAAAPASRSRSTSRCASVVEAVGVVMSRRLAMRARNAVPRPVNFIAAVLRQTVGEVAQADLIHVDPSVACLRVRRQDPRSYLVVFTRVFSRTAMK